MHAELAHLLLGCGESTAGGGEVHHPRIGIVGIAGGSNEVSDYAQGVKANVLFFDHNPGAKTAWTKKLWVYDLRTNKEFTLKQRRMARADLEEFVTCYNPGNRNERKQLWSEKKNPEGRWRVFTYEELIARDKCSLDLFWLKDESLEDSAKLPDPHVLAEEIADDLRAALEQIESVLGDLQERARVVGGRDR